MQKKASMPHLSTLQIHVNAQQTFFLNEKTISRFSGKLRKIIKQEKRSRNSTSTGIQIDEFPGGADGFELVCRYCYSNGNFPLNVYNVCLLHCCAVFLGMTDNLLQQTHSFFQGILLWNDLLICLNTCQSFFPYADSFGLVDNLISSLLSKISQNSDITTLFHCPSSSSSSSSPETSKSGGKAKAWWFDDMTILPPVIIERFVKALGGYGADNNSLVLTRFLLHYLKTALQSRSSLLYSRWSHQYGGLADTAVHGVVMLTGKTSAFSCRGLFWVLRIVCGFGLSRECKGGLERLIGGVLDQAKLDDLLVSGGGGGGGVYDVNLVVRLVRLFVQNHNHNHNHNHNRNRNIEKMKKVGGLIDKYLGEIAPDQNLKISKFLGVAESLADCARDCFDGVYRAIEIYLEAHPWLSSEERSRLCRCLNYGKLSLEACKELAKNPKIPPRVAIEALASQHSNIPSSSRDDYFVKESPAGSCSSNTYSSSSNHKLVMLHHDDEMTKGKGKGVDPSHSSTDNKSFSPEQINEALKINLQRMQWRVVELEKACRNIKGQMSRMVEDKVVITPSHTQPRSLPRMCS